MLTLEEIFPPFALRIAGGPLELRVLRDDDLPELVELIRSGIQVPGLPCPSSGRGTRSPSPPGRPTGSRRVPDDLAEVVASAAVSRKAGYVDNGRRRLVQDTRQGKLGVDEQRVVVTPDTFVRAETQVSVEGADAVRQFLGIDHTPAAS